MIRLFKDILKMAMTLKDAVGRPFLQLPFFCSLSHFCFRSVQDSFSLVSVYYVLRVVVVHLPFYVTS